MSVEVIVSIITSVCALAGVIVTSIASSKNTAKQLNNQTNLMAYRIAELEKKVEKHNNLVERTYRLEERVKEHDKEIGEIRARS